MNISAKDRDRLRSLASQQAELAASERNRLLYRDWIKHGAFSSDSRPMIRIELWTFEQDILPPLMMCEGEDARNVERMLLSNIVNFMLFEDDTLVQDHVGVPMNINFIPFGLVPKRQQDPGGGVGYRFDPYLVDLEDDFHKLGPSQFYVDRQAHARRIEELTEIIGDILPVYTQGSCMECCLTQNIIHLMHMDDMFCAMMDYPELFHKMMDMLAEDYIRYFQMLETEGLYLASARDEHLGQGSYCFTEDLPKDGSPVAMKDMWLYMDSQETSGISPATYKELILPYYKKVSEKFGLLSYGCCEAVHGIWDDCLDTLENMRKVSISPWCDEAFMGDRLRGKKIVYLRKPTPNLLGVGSVLDEEATSKCFADTVAAAKGCALEIAQRDVYEIHNTPDKVKRYIELARREMDKHIK